MPHACVLQYFGRRPASLAGTNPLRRASGGWSPFATFLAPMTAFVRHDCPVAILPSYAAFSALCSAMPRGLAEWERLGAAGSIPVPIGIAGRIAVIKTGRFRRAAGR